MTAAAAIDIGTNSLRLLVVDGDHQRRRTRIAGLGRGLDVTGHLAPKGRQRALEILSEYRAEMDAAGVDWFRAVMTAVGRRASDARDFCQEAAAILGEEPQIISGVEEARLSYAGAIGDLDGGDWTVVDIGGGSTEIVGPAGAESFDVGSVVLTDAYLTERPASSDDLEAARSHALEVIRTTPVGGQVVGVAGTWTSLAGMLLGLEPYDPDQAHHTWVDRSQIDEWTGRLAAMDLESTARIPGLEPARAPVILGGVIVAGATLDVLGVDRALVSEKDLLDGIVEELLESGRPDGRVP